jgi:hypothetical protein
MSQSWSDDELIAELGKALDLPPTDIIQAAKASFAWRTIDAELAQLSYDSSVEPVSSFATRAEGSAALRSLTFEADGLAIEIEVAVGSIHGQLVPAGPGKVELRSADGTVISAEINEAGYFTAQVGPPSTFRLFCAPQGSAGVLTDWIYL